MSAQDIYSFCREYVENRNLVAWKFYNPDAPLEQVDIVITYDLTAKRTKRIELATGSVQVLSIEDLIDMKRASGRPQGLDDIEALARLR